MEGFPQADWERQPWNPHLREIRWVKSSSSESLLPQQVRSAGHTLPLALRATCVTSPQLSNSPFVTDFSHFALSKAFYILCLQNLSKVACFPFLAELQLLQICYPFNTWAGNQDWPLGGGNSPTTITWLIWKAEYSSTRTKACNRGKESRLDPRRRNRRHLHSHWGPKKFSTIIFPPTGWDAKNLEEITLPTWRHQASFLVTCKRETKSLKPKSPEGGREAGGETAGSHTKDSKPDTAVNCVLQYSQSTIRATGREGKRACSLPGNLWWEVYTALTRI